MASKIDKCMKKIDKTDVYLIKASSAVFALFLMTVWPAFNAAVMNIHWGWFLGAAIVLMCRPFKKFMKA